MNPNNSITIILYYLTAYSLGIVVLVFTIPVTGSRRNPASIHFFYTTLTMTVTVLVSTVLNYLHLPIESNGHTILTVINYTTAALFSVFFVRFIHALYPVKAAKGLNALVLFVAGTLAILNGIHTLHPFLALLPDLLLGFKNTTILYGIVLTALFCRQRLTTLHHRFMLIISIVALLVIPLLVLTEQPLIRRAMPHVFRSVTLEGPWILPGIYIIWCLVRIFEQMIEKIRDVRSAGSAFCKQYGLSPREYEVMILLVRGLRYRDIVNELCISLPTVKTHVSNLYRKTGTINRLELAHKAGMIPQNT